MSAVAATVGSTGLLLAGSATSRTGRSGFAILVSRLRILQQRLGILRFVLFFPFSGGTRRRHAVMLSGYDIGKMMMMSRQSAVNSKSIVARPLMSDV